MLPLLVPTLKRPPNEVKASRILALLQQRGVLGRFPVRMFLSEVVLWAVRGGKGVELRLKLGLMQCLPELRGLPY